MPGKYDEKVKRVKDAIELKVPDRVPIIVHTGIFPILNAGYTVAEVIYDASLQKFKDSILKYCNDFDPDAVSGIGNSYAGEGPALELADPKNMRWAGMPGDIIDKNSFQQFIEYPLLHDEEFDEFFSDRTGWALRRALPRVAAIYEPLKKTDYSLGYSSRGVRRIASVYSSPEYRTMIQNLWAIDDFYTEYQLRFDELNKAIFDLGYPDFSTGVGFGEVPFDFYSDFLRGTMLACADIYERPEDIERFIEELLPKTLAAVRGTKGIAEGKHVFMPLHKGMDSFMSLEHYRKYYWPHLQQIILAVIESGKTPHVFAEGKYITRLDCLAEVPPGKVYYHFEDIDMAVAKKKLGGIACITGGFPSALLDWGTPDQVRDTAKKLIDDCAPGGGYIFGTSCGLGNCKRENVEALFETVREYGVY